MTTIYDAKEIGNETIKSVESKLDQCTYGKFEDVKKEEIETKGKEEKLKLYYDLKNMLNTADFSAKDFENEYSKTNSDYDLLKSESHSELYDILNGTKYNKKMDTLASDWDILNPSSSKDETKTEDDDKIVLFSDALSNYENGETRKRAL